MSPEELLKAAERVRIACEGESMQELIEKMMQEMPPYVSPPLVEPPRRWAIRPCPGCEGGNCMNVACPNRIQVTYGVGWPE